MNTLPATGITSSTGTLHGEILDPGMPDYTERGFVYSLNSMPTFENMLAKLTVPVTEDDKYSYNLRGLTLGETYYVRAYAVNSVGIAYSSNQISVIPTTVLPQVLFSNIGSIDRTACTAIVRGSIVSPGDPVYTERGFVYSNINSVPTIFDKCVMVEGTEIGDYDGLLSELDTESTYYVRAYAKNEAGIAYSSIGSFSTTSIAPQVTLSQISSVDKVSHTAIAYGSIISAGDPIYVERGFVYSKNTKTPTINDEIAIVENDSKFSSFQCVLNNLELERIYYVRAYAKNKKWIAYSNVKSFKTTEELPKINTLTPTEIDPINYAATLCGQITFEGDPAYTERGFVYSDEYNIPTINDTKIVVAGYGTGMFETRITGLSGEKSTYVRAYAINHKGIVYGETIELFVPEWIELSAIGIAVQKTDIGNGYWDSVNSMCKNSTTGNKTDWRLPSKDELMSLYTNRYIIECFTWGAYWSSTYSRNAGSYACYYGIDFSNGTLNTYTTRSQMSARCVRTLK